MNYSNKIFLTLCGLLLLLWQPNESKAQSTYSYGTASSEIFRASAYDATNGTYLLGGSEDLSIDNGILVQMDEAGTLTWAQKYTHSQSMDIRDIHIKDDGNALVLAVTTNTSASRKDALLMEVDASGTVVWSKTYVDTGLDITLHKITALSSGDYILSGNSSITVMTNFTGYYTTMIRIDSGGNTLWERRDVNAANDNMSINEAIELADGNLLITGHAWHDVGNSGSFHNGFVAKIDPTDGSMLWHEIYPSLLEIGYYQAKELASGDIVLTGRIADSNLASFDTNRFLFTKISSTGTVIVNRDYNFPGGNRSFSFREDATTGNLFFSGEEAVTSAAADKENYWIELTDDGSFVDGYRYALSDYEGVPMLEINDNYIHIFSTTKSFPADPLAGANNDFAMFLIDRNNILADCNISQFTASSVEFTFSTLTSTTFTEDAGFGLTETDVTIAVEESPFQQADVCQEENPLIVDGIATDGDCDPEGSIDITVTGGEAPYIYSWSNGETTEDITGLSTGTYDVTVTDNKGDTATATFTVFSDDNIQPVALCQSGQVFLDAAGNATIDPFMLDAGSSDNCGEVTFLVEPNMFSCADIGTQTVFLTVIDMAGNTDVCETIVDVIDNVSPTALCQDITISLDATGNASIDASMIDAGSSDICGIFSMDLDITTFDCSNVGLNTVTLFVADPSGGTSICTAIVTVENNNEMTADAVVTIIPCDGTGGIIDLTVIGGIPNYTFQWSDGTEDEDLTGITTAGTYNVTITDACGNQIEQTFTMTAEQDCCTPSWVCPNDICVIKDGDGCEAIVTYDLQAVLCEGQTLTLLEGFASGAAFPLGTTTVTYQLDTGFEFLLCSFEVTVGNYTPLTSDFETSGIAAPITVAGEDNCFELTTVTGSARGAIWYQRKLDLNYGFKLDFDINLGDRDLDGADGMMFILQPLSTDLGGTGGALGFSGVTPSVGIEFDTWQNTESQYANEPIEDHIAIQKNGDLAHDAGGYLDATQQLQTVANMENDAYHNVQITWNASSQELTYIYDNSTTQTVTQDIVNTIFGGDPYVYWGWAAGTGSAYNSHRVCVNDVTFVDAITAEATITDITCEGEGMIDLTVSGGIPGYTFQWSSAADAINEDLSSITEAGDYIVTITDACGNTVVETYTVEAEECPCELFPEAFVEGCDGMETVDIADDVLFIYVNATATNPGPSNMFNALDFNTTALLGTFTYGSGSVVTIPYTSNLDIYFEDVDDGNCDGMITLDNIATCSPLPEPILCGETSVFYQALQGTDFVEYDPTTLSYNTIYTNPYGINAMGYNVEDEFVYGIIEQTNHLARVGSDGIYVDLGEVANLPNISPDAWFTGDFDVNGNLFVSRDVSSNTNLYSIDVDVFPLTATVIPVTGGAVTSADFSFVPSLGEFYGLTANQLLYSISPLGVRTDHGTVSMPSCTGGYGASYVDATGTLYFFCNTSGNLFEVDITSLTGTLLDATGITLTGNDGASCPYATYVTCTASLECPNDVSVTLDGTGCEVVVNYELNAEICEGYILTQTAGLASGGSFPLGTTVVTYELSNGTETITCSFNVNVSNVAPTAADYVLTGQAAAIIGEGDCYQLTTTSPTYQSGSIYYQSRLNLDYDFKLDFEINLGSIDGSGADGMTFILQPISSSLGGNGGDLGFTGIGPSVGVEFDTWQNSWASDPQNDHISFQRNGNLRHTAGGYLDATVTRETVPNMEVGANRPVSIGWNATTKELTYIYNNRPARTVTQDITNTIFGGNPNVFWGWSAGTGIAVNNQSVCITSVSFVEGLTVDATITDVPCNGLGMIDLTVSGGIPGYTFQWSDGSINEDLSPITMAGDYSVTITDACGHTVAQTYTVNEEECPCEIFPLVYQEECDGMNTPDPSDDIIYLNVDANNSNGSIGTYEIINQITGNSLGIFPYNNGGNTVSLVFGAGILDLRLVDTANPECELFFTDDIESCSPPCMPELACPDDINAILDGTGCDVVVDYVIETELCDEGYTLTQTAGLPSGSAFPLGTTVVTYEVSNGIETIVCSFNVNVSNVAPTAADYVLTGHAEAIGDEGNCYQLTTTSPTYQSGSIYYQARLNLDYDFQLDFEINLGSIDASGADGMMFILQPINSSLGGNGGDLGFSGIGASVGIEFDTWQNSWASDPQNDHISFQRNGNLRHTAGGYLDATVGLETVPNMEVGANRPVSIKWNAATKELTYIYNNRPARTVTQDIANTIFGGNPNVFWGWSAGTGSAVNNQSVCITSVSFVEGMTVDATIVDIPCEGTGMIDLTVSGGISGYTFLWSDGSTDEDLSPITEAGDYSVTITDACGNIVV
ncbi:MAG: hypothetical protein ACI94Y_000318, partial [Maribacter sp.]